MNTHKKARKKMPGLCDALVSTLKVIFWEKKKAENMKMTKQTNNEQT